jgi:predicted RNase H-like HicB family nuclease
MAINPPQAGKPTDVHFLEYEVVLTPEAEGKFSVAVPTLPGCASQGETREEALSMIREAIEVYIESLDAPGDPIPGPG